MRDINIKFDKGLIGKEEHGKETINIKNAHKKRLSDIEKDYRDTGEHKLMTGSRLSQEEHDQKLRLLENDRNSKIRQVSAPHDAEISKIDKEKVGWIDKQMAKYQPNRVTIEAAKLGSQESTIARQRVETLARGEGAHKFHASDYYSAGGLTSQQKKFYDTLSDTSRESVNAIKSMVDNMQKMVGNERNYGRSELDAIRSLKQGLAARKKGGADMSKLEGVVNVINKVDTGGADGNETVQGFESKVVAGSK